MGTAFYAVFFSRCACLKGSHLSCFLHDIFKPETFWDFALMVGSRLVVNLLVTNDPVMLNFECWS